ncbi:unnamed protein product [Moneuplotes crassus]|uniref:GST N-terminal domain-containing protein n=1 Tax=Euplotes crassus TaxID=5936 RepID=A0AAD1XTG6_EUPCR|nr:unnamed protein product [Moneuplotes crassus]
MSDLTIYHHPISPFAATVVAVANHFNIEHTEYRIDLAMGVQKEEWFLRINPAGKIPAIKDGDHCMGDSIEICKYLVESREIDTAFFPYKDEQKVQEIDDLKEKIKNLEPATLEIAKAFWVEPWMTGSPFPAGEVGDRIKQDIYDVHDIMEAHLVDNGTKFLHDDKEAGIIDFWAFNLIFSLVDKNFVEFDRWPKLQKWFDDCAQIQALDNIRTRSWRWFKFFDILFKTVYPTIRCLSCRTLGVTLPGQ